MNYILKDENAVFYECGFSCDNAIFLKLGSESFFITDGRYITEAKEYTKDTEVIDGGFDIYKSAATLLRKNKIKKVIYDPLNWSAEEFKKIDSKTSCYFMPKQRFSQKKRIIKSKEEIKNIKQAVSDGAEGFERFAKFLRQNIGLNEKRLFFKAQEILCRQGEAECSFSPIVAIDENAAKPHSLPTDKCVKIGSLVLFDAGVKYKRYCSDRTRVLEIQSDKESDFGKYKLFKDKKRQKIYDIVLKAQEEAIKFAKAGVKACEVDKVARSVIEKAGYGKYFIHSTGHGVGLDIHELPVISKRDETILKEGMVFTVEPGIYLPGEFGVRIEDMVVVTEQGVEIL
ncbi:MAG: aminopeptidase P family protein [Epsilonproteobacteria bacterium]|nr:aminopeptidase P family protein [Campylobacterota bacterium]